MITSKHILGISDSHSVFVPVWQNPIYFDLMVKLSGKTCPTIYYVGAAKGDDPQRIAEFFELAQRFTCTPKAFRLFSMITDDPEAYFKDADIVFIDGGATRNLIALMHEWGAVTPLIKAYERGVLIAGASAGISMLFDWCISDSIKTRILPVKGIGILKGTVCAHYNAREERRDALSALLSTTEDALPAYGLDDGVAAYFVDEALKATYSLSASRTLHEFSDTGNEIEQTRHKAVIL